MTRDIVNCIFAFIVFSTWSVLFHFTIGVKFGDFPAYYTTAHQVNSGHASQVYDMKAQQAAARLYFADGEGRAFEPPYALPMFTPLALLSPPVAKIAWDALLAVSLAVGCVVLAKVAELSGRGTLLLIGCTALSGPAFEILKVSKPAAFVFLAECLCLYFLSRQRDKLAGSATFLWLLKPHVVLPFFAFALGARRFAFIVVACVVAGVIVVSTFPFVGIQSYGAYQQLVSYLSAHPEVPGVASMPTVRGQLMRFGLDNSANQVVSNLAYAVVLVVSLWFGWKKAHRPDWWKSAVVTVFTIGLAVCPYLHLYDHIVMVPAVVFLIQRFSTNGKKYALVTCLLCASTFMLPLYAFIHYYYLIATGALINIHFIALLLLGSLALWSEGTEHAAV